MKIEHLLDLTLREVLENYVAVNNLECGYYYGIAPASNIDELAEYYNFEEYEEAFNIENVVSDELLVSYKDNLLSYEKLERIMRILV